MEPAYFMGAGAGLTTQQGQGVFLEKPVLSFLEQPLAEGRMKERPVLYYRPT
jgi:hypothetical protein